MLEEIIKIILSPQLQKMLLPLKIIALVVTTFFVGSSVYFLLTTRWFKLFFWYDFIEFFTLEIYGSVWARARWKVFKKRTEKISEQDCNSIIISGHNLLDTLLERLAPMYQANNWSERLAKIGSGTFTDTKGLWEAHELYRSVTRESNFRATIEQAEMTAKAYEQALKDLEVI